MQRTRYAYWTIGVIGASALVAVYSCYFASRTEWAGQRATMKPCFLDKTPLANLTLPARISGYWRKPNSAEFVEIAPNGDCNARFGSFEIRDAGKFLGNERCFMIDFHRGKRDYRFVVSPLSYPDEVLLPANQITAYVVEVQPWHSPIVSEGRFFLSKKGDGNSQK